MHFRRARHLAGAFAFALVLAGPLLVAGASDAAAPPDSTAVPEPADTAWTFDVITRADYLRRHAISLDNFLEFAPGGVVVRAGPIGNVAAYSRWGIGRGRATLFMNGIPMNDPQNDLAPWVHVATSGVGTLRMDPAGSWIEGAIDFIDTPPLPTRPTTFIELSKGTNDLRQRRARFASEEGPVGLDLSYDEVLDDGYAFDAAGGSQGFPDYGKSRSRNSAIILRGAPDAAARFRFGVRQYQSTSTGTLTDPSSENQRDGHLAWFDAGVGPATLTVFGLGNTAGSRDSTTVNETSGALLDLHPTWKDTRTRVRLLGRRTTATQDVGAASRTHQARFEGHVEASRALGAGEWIATGDVAGDDETPFVWGATAGVRAASERTSFTVQGGRSFRLPNLGERYLPVHVRDGRILAGDPDVDPESALEIRGDWDLRLGPFANRVTGSWIRSSDTIAFRPRTVGTETWRVAANASTTPAMTIVEERLHGEGRIGPLLARGLGCVMVSSGDREEAFRGVPDLQANASFLIGGEMFEKTSALYAGAEFLHVGARVDYDGTALSAFNVVNLLLEGRLIDVHLYLKYLNVLDEQYTTLGDYLMTPRTLVYGLAWTLFD